MPWPQAENDHRSGVLSCRRDEDRANANPLVASGPVSTRCADAGLGDVNTLPAQASGQSAILRRGARSSRIPGETAKNPGFLCFPRLNGGDQSPLRDLPFQAKPSAPWPAKRYFHSNQVFRNRACPTNGSCCGSFLAQHNLIRYALSAPKIPIHRLCAFLHELA